MFSLDFNIVLTQLILRMKSFSYFSDAKKKKNHGPEF